MMLPRLFLAQLRTRARILPGKPLFFPEPTLFPWCLSPRAHALVETAVQAAPQLGWSMTVQGPALPWEHSTHLRLRAFLFCPLAAALNKAFTVFNHLELIPQLEI